MRCSPIALTKCYRCKDQIRLPIRTFSGTGTQKASRSMATRRRPTGSRKPTPRRNPKQERSRHTYDSILTAAELLAESLGEDGFANFTAERVAERAGVSIGTLYQYFSDKREILAELLDRTNRADLAIVEEAFEQTKGRPLAERLDEAMRRVITERFEKRLSLYRFLIMHRERIVRPDTNRRVQEKIVTQFQGLLAEHSAELGGRNPYHVSFLITRFFMNAMGAAVTLRPELVADPGFTSLLRAWIRNLPR